MPVEITLSKGYVAVVDDCDGDLAQLKWHALVGSTGVVYASRRARVGKGRHTSVLLHRLVVERVLGRKLASNEFVDHIDGNGRNCARENLRVCSSALNQGNRKRAKNNSSGTTGVGFDRARGKWKAAIQVNGRTLNLGRFDTYEAACEVRRNAEAEHFGEFTNTGGR